MYGVYAFLAAAEPVDAADDVRAAKDRDRIVWHSEARTFSTESDVYTRHRNSRTGKNSLMLPAVTGWYVGRKSMIEMKIW